MNSAVLGAVLAVAIVAASGAFWYQYRQIRALQQRATRMDRALLRIAATLDLDEWWEKDED